MLPLSKDFGNAALALRMKGDPSAPPLAFLSTPATASTIG
jgi:hypothetical protein